MKKLILIILTSVFLISLPLVAFAQSQENFNLPESDTFEGNLFRGGNLITITGNVNGDTALAGNEIIVNGTVKGTLVAVGSNVTIGEKAEIFGNAFLGASNITINGKITGNVYLGASSVLLGEKANLEQDLYSGSSLININGKIGRDFYGGSGSAAVAGSVGRKVNIEVDYLTVEENASIGTDLVYRSKRDATISDSAKIGGEIEKKKPRAMEQKDKKPASERIASVVSAKVRGLLTILAVALILVLLFPIATAKIADSIKNKIWSNLLAGTVIFFVTPILFLVLLFTIIGLPIALVLIFIYGILIYIAKIYVGTIAGRYLIEQAWPKMKDPSKMIWGVMLGTLVIYLIMMIPVIGGVIGLISVLVVLGVFWVERKTLFSK